MNLRRTALVLAGAAVCLLCWGLVLGSAAGEASPADRGKIQAVLADVLRCVFSKNYHGLTGSLTSRSRVLIGEEADWKKTGLDSLIDRFNAAWLRKYNDHYSRGLRTASIPYSIHAEEKYASVNLPAGGERRPISLNLLDEGRMSPSWRIETPLNLNSARLEEGLEKALTSLEQNYDKWPADSRQMFRITAQKVFAALTGEQAAMSEPLDPAAAPPYRRAALGQQSEDKTAE